MSRLSFPPQLTFVNTDGDVGLDHIVSFVNDATRLTHQSMPHRRLSEQQTLILQSHAGCESINHQLQRLNHCLSCAKFNTSNDIDIQQFRDDVYAMRATINQLVQQVNSIHIDLYTSLTTP